MVSDRTRTKGASQMKSHYEVAKDYGILGTETIALFNTLKEAREFAKKNKPCFIDKWDTCIKLEQFKDEVFI